MQDERGPGLDLVCVLCAAVVREGLPLYFCVYLFVLLNSLNVRRFPPPPSRSTNCVTLVPIGKKEAGTGEHLKKFNKNKQTQK